MKVVHYTDELPTMIDNEVAKGIAGRVLAGGEDGAKNFTMRLFEVKPGGYTPKHTHDWEHEVFVHGGEGKVFRNGEWVPVPAGTALFIPGGEEHQFKNDGDAPFTFICVIPAGPPEL